MTVAAGARLGPYVVVGPLGAGGMGEVWCARDTKLGREVAIKVLPSALAEHPERRRRFEEEARAASALNHPNIVTVYEIASADSGLYIAMERVEGRTLRAHLEQKEGPLPIKRLLDIAVQLAEGVAKAHAADIVHRDLKPENVMVSADGFVKILDFGLAKLRVPEWRAYERDQPTQTSPGHLVGTPAYMSPEQARGEVVDFRSDQFALGSILYEMATSRAAFRRGSAADTLAAILKEEPPPLAELCPSLPSPFRWAIERCLAKDPEGRYASTRDLARDLEDIRDHLSEAGTALPGVDPRARAGWLAPLLPWAVAAGVALVAVVVGTRRPSSSPAPASPKRFVVALSDIDRYDEEMGRSLALLPDASGFAYAGQRGSDRRIHLHALGEGVSRSLPGTERALDPFFSPDGKWLGFFQDNQLKKVAVGGGPSFVICDAPSGRGASWGEDDRIVFGSVRQGLRRVPASGGRPEALTTLDAARGEGGHTAAQVLPGGRAVLFTVLNKTGAMEDATIAAVSLRDGERRVLVRGGASARYVPTGHLVYVRGTDLLAVPFDPDRLAIAGPPVLAVPGIRVTPQYLYGQFDVSSDGTLAYVSGGGTELQRTLVWADRKGTVRALPVPPRPYFHPRLLPGEQGVIVEVEETPHNLWHCDLRSGALTRLTHEGANHRPVLSPDGRLMAFSSDRTVPRSLFRQATDGSGTPERLLEAPYPHNATSWSPDGRWLAFSESHPETKEDIWVLPLEGDRRPRPFLRTPFSESSAAFSPDGHWIAFSSDESGRREVLVTAFPGPGPRRQISTNGGELPVFSRGGRKLFYQLGDQILVVEIVTQPALTSGPPRLAFEVPVSRLSSGLPNYDVSATGDSLLAVKAVEGGAGPPRAYVVLNWFEELRRLTIAK